MLYIAVSAVLTGMVRYDQIDINAPVADAFRQKGLPWAQRLIDVGAITGITSVLLVMMLSQPRVLLAMARDGLVPPSFFGAVHEKFRTPWKSTILTGLFVSIMAAFLPLRILAELTNIGTLLAFVIVCSAVLIMRRTHPEAKRPFRAPFVPLVPILGNHLLPDPHVLAPRGELVATFHLAGDRIPYLFQLRPPSQRHGQLAKPGE